MTQGQVAEPIPVAVALDFVAEPPALVDMGATFTLLVAVPQIDGCDLAGARFELREGEEIRASGTLGPVEIPDPNPDLHDPREGRIDLRPRVSLAIRAPARPGSFAWRLVVPDQCLGETAIAGDELGFDFATAEHRTSLAAWDVPSPVGAGARLRFRIGAKCSAGCDLRGLGLVAQESGGAPQERATLGTECWPDAQGLYWTEMELEAPPCEGQHDRIIRFDAQGLDLPHGAAQTRISFLVVPPAAHRVTVRVREADGGPPIADAQVRLGPHRKATGADGLAVFDVAGGSHRLFVWKADHAFEEAVHDVQADGDLVVTGVVLPKPNPYARWEG